ncbi:MAG: TonB-dependent receptor [Rhodospirillaceae bacterium]|nr:TonB-dependent receptor [Rhodospirillaceae bacterium]MDE0361901.1 TonB-dependent receptor [Rhodospirillaceae bacterium]
MMRSLVLFSGLAAVAATAQESTDQASSGDELVIEQIIVTATRREESVTDVPLAVSAYDADRIELSRVTDIMELMRVAPSFHVASGQAESVGVTARIRGVGTNSDNPGLESSVGMYVDGVYRNRATVGLTELGAIERIEVLRGPQGTLFGRNSSAGVVSIITALPDPDGSGYADISIGSYGSNRVEAGVSGGIGQDASARLDAVFFQRDGFLEDLNYDRSFNNRDRTFIRGQVVFEPSDTVRMRLIGDYTDRDENCCAAVGLIEGPTAAAVHQIAQLQTRNPNTVGIAFDPYARGATVTETSGYYQSVKEGGVSLEIDADLPFARLVSVTATRDWETAREMDIDFSAMDMGERPHGEYKLGFETLTQEIRLNGQNGPLDWLVGAYYADEYLPYQDALDFGFGYSFYANGIAQQAAAGIGAGFDGFRQLAQIDALEAGAAGIALGAQQLSGGLAGLSAGLSQLSQALAPFAPLLPPGFPLPMVPTIPMAPTLSAMLPSYPGFAYSDWPGYEGIAGANLYGHGARDSYEQESRSWALFTHNTVELQNDFELTLGLRYTVEDKSMTANLRSTDQVCLPFSQQFLGSLQSTQGYFAGVGAYAHGLGAYTAELQQLKVPTAELQAFAGQLGQLAGALPPELAAMLPPGLNQQLGGLVQGAAQLEQAVQGIQAGAAQLLPGLPQVVAGGEQLLTDPALVEGLGAIVALGCNPFADPTRDGTYVGDLDEDEATGTLRLSRSIGDHLVYGGYSRGYKAGGFNMDRSGLNSPILTSLTGTPLYPSIEGWIFLPETVDTYEIGAKFSLDDWRGLLDISLFHEDFEGYQLTAFTGFAFEALNVPEVISKGVEIEARGVVNNTVEIFGGLTYADVRFGSGPEHDFRAGRQLTHAPKVTGVGGVTLRFPLGPLSGAFHIDARYTGDHNTGANLDPLKHQEAYTVVNARLILRSASGMNPWTVDFWGQNITGEDYAITIFDAPLQTGTYDAFLGDPQLYGVSIRYDF